MKHLFGAAILALAASASATDIQDVRFEPHAGAAVPLSLRFNEGRLVQLGDYLGRAPVVLVLGYGTCVNLCSVAWKSTTDALFHSGLRADSDYVALFVSIDPRDEQAPAERRTGWHVLTGAHAAARLARAVGFNYLYDAASGQYAHPAGIVVLTPAGHVSSYFTGLQYDPAALRAGIRSAGREAVAADFTSVLLRCFHDPVNGRYSTTILPWVKIACLGLIACLALLIWRCTR